MIAATGCLYMPKIRYTSQQNYPNKYIEIRNIDMQNTPQTQNGVQR